MSTRMPIPQLKIALAVLLAAGMTTHSGCKEEETCNSNVDCPTGQYCGASGVCDFECRTDTDCATGQHCTTLGKCQSGVVGDGGALDGGGDQGQQGDLGDLGLPPDAAADLSPADAGDQGMPLDQAQPPDQGVVQDQAVAADLGDAGSTDASGTAGWITVTAGKFYMGSPTTESCRDTNNEVYHEVTLTKNYEIATTEVTRSEFYQVMNYSPSMASGCTSACPVDNVSWSEAAAYCNALSASKSLGACYSCTGTGSSVSCTVDTTYASSGAIYSCPGYRLPTGAEWEFAARSGTTTPLYNGAITSCTGIDSNADAIAWYKMNASNSSHPVKGKKANAWGLYDMAGNVTEWTNDFYQENLGSSSVSDPTGPTTGTLMVLRGGSWNQETSYLRSASRFKVAATGRSAFIGFRCVKTSP